MATTWRGFGNFASREPTPRYGSKFPLADAVILLDDSEAWTIRRTAFGATRQGRVGENAKTGEGIPSDTLASYNCCSRPIA